MAVSYLTHHFGRDFLRRDLLFVRNLDEHGTEVLLRMMERKINSPLTSSCGRLFDAVAALIGVRQRVNYEAQAAIELEMSIAPSCCGRGYPLQLVAEGDHWIISTHDLFEALIDDLSQGAAPGAISRRFHDGLVEGFAGIATLIRNKSRINQVCLSGGTFHNAYLARELERRLFDAGFKVFVQREVPSGDGGLSLGQALVASFH